MEQPGPRFWPQALAAWSTPAFAEHLKAALEALPAAALPLFTVWPLADTPIQVSVLGSEADTEQVVVRCNVFFNEVMAGCSCGEEPQLQSAALRLQVTLDRRTAGVIFTPLD